MHDVLDITSSVSAEAALLIIFLYLIVCGLGLPLPEEVALVSSGYLAYLGLISIPNAILVPFVAIILGDTCLFYIGHRAGLKIFEFRWFKRIINRKRLRWSRRYFEKYGSGIVFAGRFLVGFRIPIFLTAAILRMRIRTFVIINFIAATISVPLIVLLAFRFGDKIDQALQIMRSARTMVMIAAIAFVLVVILYYRFRRQTKQAVKPVSS